MAKHTCVYCGKPLLAGGPTAEHDLICPHCGSKNVMPLREAAAARFASLNTAVPGEPSDSPVAGTANRLMDNIEKVIVGKRNEILLGAGMVNISFNVLRCCHAEDRLRLQRRRCDEAYLPAATQVNVFSKPVKKILRYRYARLTVTTLQRK